LQSLTDKDLYNIVLTRGVLWMFKPMASFWRNKLPCRYLIRSLVLQLANLLSTYGKTLSFKIWVNALHPKQFSYKPNYRKKHFWNNLKQFHCPLHWRWSISHEGKRLGYSPQKERKSVWGWDFVATSHILIG